MTYRLRHSLSLRRQLLHPSPHRFIRRNETKAIERLQQMPSSATPIQVQTQISLKVIRPFRPHHVAERRQHKQRFPSHDWIGRLDDSSSRLSITRAGLQNSQPLRYQLLHGGCGFQKRLQWSSLRFFTWRLQRSENAVLRQVFYFLS